MSPGIFSFFRIPLFVALFILALMSCHQQDDKHAHHPDHAAYVDSIIRNVRDMDRDEAIVFIDSVYASFADAGPGDLYRKYDFLGFIYLDFKKDYPKALCYIDSALAQMKDYGSNGDYAANYAKALFYKGDLLMAQKNYDEALQYYYQGRDVIGLAGDLCVLGDYTGRLAIVCYRQEKYRDAIGYFNAGIEATSHCSDEVHKAYSYQSSLDNIALCYHKMGMLDSALFYYNSALSYIESNTNFRKHHAYAVEGAKGIIFGNMGEVYYEKGDTTAAETLFRESIRINSQKGFENRDAQFSQIKLAKLYLETGRLQKAGALLKDVRASLDSLPHENAELRWWPLQLKHDERTGRHDLAYAHLLTYSKLKDSLALNGQLSEVDVSKEYDNIRRQYEIGLLKKQSELKTIYLLIAVSVSVLTIIIVLLIWQNWKRSKRNEQELMRARDIAEEAAIAKQQFLTNMSHEIRTPMNAVIGMTHLLLHENPRPEQKENLNVLKFSSENLLALINDILDYGKIEAGEITFENIDFNLKELVNNLKLAHSVRAEEKGIRIYSRIDPQLPDIVIGDPVRLTQILNNLFSNAIKFTHKGSVTLNIKLKEAVDEYMQVYFSVTDTGIGIAPELKDYIFESFTQASSDTTRHFGGTGLGLSITKRLLQLQGSDISLESEPGKGSVFSFVLQLKTSRKSQHDLDAVYNGAVLAFNDLSGYRLLVVDDNEINMMVASKFLRKWALSVDCVQSGLEAVERVKEVHYDMILMDLQMPGMTGYEASRRIRALHGERFKDIPIIALSADVMAETKEKVIEAGMNDYVSKPFNPHELYGKIARYLKMR